MFFYYLYISLYTYVRTSIKERSKVSTVPHPHIVASTGARSTEEVGYGIRQEVIIVESVDSNEGIARTRNI